MNVTASFCFHAVGQGLFYTGLLNQKKGNQHDLFSFVFDCGSTSSKHFLHREIDDFKEMLQPSHEDNYRKHLDLLIVSHLHDDHVNGLEYLLKDVAVDTVVMPCMEENLRILAGWESNEGDALQAFYDDPVAWFIHRGVRRIFLASASLEGKEDFFNDLSFQGYRQDSETQNQSDLMVRSSDILFEETRQGIPVYHLKNGALLLSDRFYWSFQLRNLKTPVMCDFIDTILEFQEKHEFREKDGKRHLSLEEIFHSNKLTTELQRKLREELQSGYIINRTSAVVIHEPFMYDCTRITSGSSGWPSLLVGSKENFWHVDKLFFFHKKKRQGHCRTILTGDIQFESKDEVDILKPERGMEAIDYAVIEYPHHGAKSREDREADFSELTRCSMHVISAGLTNRYGHPSQSVVDKLGLTVFVNERNSFDYYYVISDERS